MPRKPKTKELENCTQSSRSSLAVWIAYRQVSTINGRPGTLLPYLPRTIPSTRYVVYIMLVLVYGFIPEHIVGAPRYLVYTTISVWAKPHLLGCRLCRCELVSLVTPVNSNFDFTTPLSLFFSFFFLACSVISLSYSFFSLVNASRLLEFVCRTCRTQYDGTSFHCLLCWLL